MKATIVNISLNVPSAKGNVVLIGLNNKTTLVRTEGQFKKDLEKSFLKLRDAKDLLGGTVEGEMKFHKANTAYTSNEYTDKEGNVIPSKTDVYKKDGYTVFGLDGKIGGFVSLTINPKADMMNRTAAASAELMNEMLGLTGSNSNESSFEKEEVKEEVKELNPQIG